MGYSPRTPYRSQNCKKECKSVYYGGRPPPLIWLHTSAAHLYKWQSTCLSNVWTPWGHLWKPHRQANSILKAYPSKLLLTKDKGRLHELCEKMRTLPKTCRLEPLTSRGVAFDLQPMAFHTWGNWQSQTSRGVAIRQMEYLVVAIEYFTKWIEAEPVAQITTPKIQHFVWKNVVCRFGVPRHLVSDNETEFTSR